MASKVEVGNRALIKLGAARVSSFEDGTKQALLLSQMWDTVRDAEIAAHPWTFAIKRVTLPASSTEPDHGWAYAYPLPSDYLAVVEVGDNYAFYDNSSGSNP